MIVSIQEVDLLSSWEGKCYTPLKTNLNAKNLLNRVELSSKFYFFIYIKFYLSYPKKLHNKSKRLTDAAICHFKGAVTSVELVVHHLLNGGRSNFKCLNLSICR